MGSLDGLWHFFTGILLITLSVRVLWLQRELAKHKDSTP